jgi:5'-AMP-activated protein kinase catalytic alpha subunit
MRTALQQWEIINLVSHVTPVSYLINVGRDLGKGTFGKVRVGTHLLTDEKVAVKILEKDKIVDASDAERVSREIYILKILRHPVVV